VRRTWLLAVITSVGCGYPDFAFRDDATPDVAAEIAADVAEDTVAPIEETAVDSAVDSATVDSAKPDVADEVIVDAPTTYCMKSPLHFFCADWDSSTEPTYGWTGFSNAGGGTLAVDGIAYSAPRSFLAQFPAGATESTANVTRAMNAPAIDSVARIDVRVRFGVASYSDGAMFLKLQRTGGRGASLWLGSAGLYAEALGASYKPYPITKSIAAATWYHVRLEANLKVSGATVRVFIDDMTTPLVDATDASTADTEGADRELVSGLYASNTSTLSKPFIIRIDDVSLDWL
jgi:hypothetical protein